jgi:hypothetical protein
MTPGWLCSVTAATRSSVARSAISLTSVPCRCWSRLSRSFVSNGQIDDLLLDFQHQDGRAIRVQLNGRIHQTPQGGARTHCILTDISERQRRDEARRRSAALLHHQAERALAMLELPKAAEQMEESTFIQHGLAVVEQLTGSPVSFLCFVDADSKVAQVSPRSAGRRARAAALRGRSASSFLPAGWPLSGTRPWGSAHRCSSTPSKQASPALTGWRLPASNG